MLSLLLAVPSCIYSVWYGVIPTSYFIFILVSLIFYPVDCSRWYARYIHVQCIAYTYAHAYCTCAGVYVQSTIKWRRSKRKSPRWTWILLSEDQTLPYYTKGTSRTKIRPSHVKIMVFRPLIWAVERWSPENRGLADFRIYR